MLIADNNEEKRSILWQKSTLISSVLIVLIILYFISKIFLGNPIKGTWQDEDGRYKLGMKSRGKGTIELMDLTDKTPMSVTMDYTLEKDDKMITIHVSADNVTKAVDAGKGEVSKEMVEKELEGITGEFDFSIDKNELTLTERDYGEQLLFKKQ